MKKYIIIVFFIVFFPLLVKAEECSLGPVSIDNAGFETLVVDNDERWDIFPSGTENLGWNVEWYGEFDSFYDELRPEIANLEVQKGVYPWLAYEGDQFTELDSDWNGPKDNFTYSQFGEPASVSISQDIKTIPGAVYELKFAFSSHPITSWLDNVLGIEWNNSLVDVLSASGTSQTVWNQYTYRLKAEESITRLKFSDLGNPDSFGTLLDDVKLELVECPVVSNNEEENNNTQSSGGGRGSYYNSSDKDEKGIIVLGFDSGDLFAPSICEQEARDISSIIMMTKNNERDVALFHKVYDPTLEVADTRLARLSYFISSNGECTKHLGAGERAGVVNSFKTAFGRLPLSYDDWLDVIKISNGQWPTLRSESAETKAKESFVSIYSRTANLDNQNDNNAVIIMAYGLRPKPRVMKTELISTKIFFDIKGYYPVTAIDWDMVRAIGYSGAKR